MITQNSMILYCKKEMIASFLCNSIILRPASSLSRARQIMSLYQGNMSGVNDWSITLWLMLLSYGYGVWKKSKSNIPSFSYPCFRLVYSSIDSVRRVCKEIISILKVDGTTKQINKQKKEEKNAQRSLLTWNAPNASYARLKLSLAKQCSESGRRNRWQLFQYKKWKNMAI